MCVFREKGGAPFIRKKGKQIPHQTDVGLHIWKKQQEAFKQHKDNERVLNHKDNERGVSTT